MFDVAFSELLLILAVAALLLRPKDIPGAVRALARCARQVKSLTQGIRAQVKEVVDELEGTNTIVTDLEGRSRPAYDVTGLASLKRHEP